MSLKQEIKKELTDLISDSTSHGLPRLIKSKSIVMKAMWFALTLISVYFCTIQIIDTLQDYLKFDTITKFETIYEMPSLFPAITICSLNQFQTEFALNELSKRQMISSTDVGKRIESLNLLSQFNETTKKMYTYSLNETLIDCSFSGSRKCDASDFDWYFDPFYGSCYRFNSGNASRKAQHLVRTGNAFGLRIELFTGDEDKVPLFLRTNGYQIIINNQSNLPTINEGYQLMPGVQTNLAISRSFSYRLGEPYNNCIKYLIHDAFDSVLYRAIFDSGQAYRQSDCFVLFLQQEIIKRCKCFLPLFLSLNTTKLCIENELFLCSMNKFREILDENVTDEFQAYCPLECDTRTYTLESSSSVFPLNKYAEQLLNRSKLFDSFSLEKLKRSLLSVNVYYKDFAYTRATQLPKTKFFDLISNIGGILGVYVGISLLSLAELFEIIFQLLIISIRNRKISRTIVHLK